MPNILPNPRSSTIRKIRSRGILENTLGIHKLGTLWGINFKEIFEVEFIIVLINRSLLVKLLIL